MLREPAEPAAAEPKQSGSFRYLQGMLEAGEGGRTLLFTPPAFPFLGVVNSALRTCPIGAFATPRVASQPLAPPTCPS